MRVRLFDHWYSFDGESFRSGNKVLLTWAKRRNTAVGEHLASMVPEEFWDWLDTGGES